MQLTKIKPTSVLLRQPFKWPVRSNKCMFPMQNFPTTPSNDLKSSNNGNWHLCRHSPWVQHNKSCVWIHILGSGRREYVCHYWKGMKLFNPAEIVLFDCRNNKPTPRQHGYLLSQSCASGGDVNYFRLQAGMLHTPHGAWGDVRMQHWETTLVCTPMEREAGSEQSRTKWDSGAAPRAGGVGLGKPCFGDL